MYTVIKADAAVTYIIMHARTDLFVDASIPNIPKTQVAGNVTQNSKDSGLKLYLIANNNYMSDYYDMIFCYKFFKHLNLFFLIKKNLKFFYKIKKYQIKI